METRPFLFTAIPLLGIVLVFSYLNIHQESLAPEHISRELCQSIEYNGEDRIDLLFISTKEDAESYTEFLLSSEPYKSKRNYFNSYVIEGQDITCKSYKGIAILCNTPEVQSIAKQCPHDYIVVVKEEEKRIRSSAYGNVLSINKVHDQNVLLHEMGHAFGNLAEEYGGAKVPQESKNCVKSCDDFQGEIDSCNLECSESNYYRSIFSGVMRTLLTSDYGLYNDALISELLEKNKPKESSVTGNQIQEDISCNQAIYSVKIAQDSQTNVEADTKLFKGCAPDKSGAGDLCIGSKCYPSVMFTDAQDIGTQDTLEGEVVVPEEPLIFYLEQDPLNPLVDVVINGRLVDTINTNEIGATACLM